MIFLNQLRSVFQTLQIQTFISNMYLFSNETNRLSSHPNFVLPIQQHRTTPESIFETLQLRYLTTTLKRTFNKLANTENVFRKHKAHLASVTESTGYDRALNTQHFLSARQLVAFAVAHIWYYFVTKSKRPSSQCNT